MCNFLLLLEFFEIDFLSLCIFEEKQWLFYSNFLGFLSRSNSQKYLLQCSKPVSHLLSLSYQALFVINCQREFIFVRTLVLVHIPLKLLHPDVLVNSNPLASQLNFAPFIWSNIPYTFSRSRTIFLIALCDDF